MIPFTFRSHPTVIHYGTDIAAERLSHELERLSLGRVVVIATTREAERVARLRLVPAPALAGVFRDVKQHVPAETAAAARRFAIDAGADGLVSVGGGSATGTAKAIARETGLPIIALPTTYAGSELTPVWGITTDGIKRTGTDPRVLPRVVISDTRFVASMPKNIALPSALNALAHALESYWAPGRNPVTAVQADEAVRALSEGLRNGHGTGGDDQLVYGSLLAGLAFASAGSGLHHKICHALGGAFDLPHAPLHAVILPHVVSFNLAVLPDESRRIGDALGGRAGGADALDELYSTIGAPRGLVDIGFDAADLDRAVDVVSAALPIANPREFGPDDVRRLLGAALVGRDSH